MIETRTTPESRAPLARRVRRIEVRHLPARAHWEARAHFGPESVSVRGATMTAAWQNMAALLDIPTEGWKVTARASGSIQFEAVVDSEQRLGVSRRAAVRRKIGQPSRSLKAPR